MTSDKLTADPAHVRLSTPDLAGNANLTEIRPSTVRQLDRVTLVRAVQPAAMGPVGAESEPESLVPSPVVDIRLDLRAARLAIGENAMKTVNEKVTPIRSEDDDRGKLDALTKSLGVLGDELIIKLGANLGAGVGDEIVEQKTLASGGAQR